MVIEIDKLKQTVEEGKIQLSQHKSDNHDLQNELLKATQMLGKQS